MYFVPPQEHRHTIGRYLRLQQGRNTCNLGFQVGLTQNTPYGDLRFFELARFTSLLRRGKMAAQSDKLSFLGSISPWGPSRSTTPKIGTTSDVAEKSPDGLGRQQGGDHTVSHRHQLSRRLYPRDCPKLNVRWFYAVDVGHRCKYFRDGLDLP